MDPHPRDEAKEAVLGEIIAHGSDAVLSFLNDTCTDGLERQDEEAGYDDDQAMEDEGHRCNTLDAAIDPTCRGTT